MFKKVMAIAAAIVIGAFSVLVSVAPAQASYADCPTVWNGQFPVVGCFYWNSNGGNPYFFTDRTQGCKNMSGSWNDNVSSLKNNNGSGYLMRFWENANCSGASGYLRPNSTLNLNWVWNDEITSYAVYPCSQVDEC